MNNGNSHKSAESGNQADSTEDLPQAATAGSASRNEGAATAKGGVETSGDLASLRMEGAGAAMPPIGTSGSDSYEDATESLEVMTEADADHSNHGSASAMVGFHAPPGFSGAADMQSGNAFLPVLPEENK